MFDRLLAIYRRIRFDEGSRSGTLVLSDEAERQELLTLLGDDVLQDTGLAVEDGNPVTCPVGTTLRVTANDPKGSWGVVATDMNQLLQRSSERLHEPRHYYVISERYASSDNPNLLPRAIERYRSVLRFVGTLRESADYFDKQGGTLIYLGDDKYELAVQYDNADLEAMDNGALDKLLVAFADTNDAHKEQKLSLLSKSVRSITSTVPPKTRFSVMLRHLAELQKHFADGYRLFVADFSYDKVMNQIEAAKVEEIGKIHKAFADIQNQILGIPVATVVVATQMKAAKDVGYEFWLNTAVLVGCYVFVVLSALVLRNQLHTLDTLAEELERKKKQMLDQYSQVADLVLGSFPALFKRLRTQRIAFWTVGAILVIGLLLAHVVYFALTDPAASWAVARCHAIANWFASLI